MKVLRETSRYEDGRRILTQEVEYTEQDDLRALSTAQNALAFQLEQLEAAGEGEPAERLRKSISTLRERVTSLSAACEGYHR